MGDLTKVLGGPWSAKKREPDPPEVQLRDAIAAAGLTPPDTIHLDGKIHRFNSGTKGTPGRSDKSGWYIGFADGIPAGRFGCWRSSVEHSWRADVGRTLTPAEEMAHIRRMSEAKALHEAEKTKRHQVTADTVDKIWQECTPASPDHPYLKAKGIGVHGARVTGDGRLVVPLFDRNKNLTTLQYIDAEGGKLYHAGGRVEGAWWVIGGIADVGTLYLAEGFATAATIYEATGRPCVVAYSAANMLPVAREIRDANKNREIAIVADHDLPAKASGICAGQHYAEKAGAEIGARVVIPPTPGDANDYQKSGHDLSGLLNPPKTDWLIRADAFCEKPAPVLWLIKRWVQREALGMIHGPPGAGKTFILLDWALRMATGMPDWCGNRVSPAPVAYLAGEGLHGLRGRIAAWKHFYKARDINLWISRGGLDLNTRAGYQACVEHLRQLPVTPKFLCIDTMHRFLAGDENSAQDAKTMLDACAALIEEFHCSIVLAHHPGVAEEAQHRARGSSAWRGALDIEISVSPPKGNGPGQIIQRKSKDTELAEPIYFELQQVKIPGWLDEDGEAVTSAVMVRADAPPAIRKPLKLDDYRKTLERAWWAAGAELVEGRPYVSRDALTDLMQADGVTERTALNKVKPANTGGIIHDLLNAEIIERYEEGWVVIDKGHASALVLRKGSGK